MTTLFNFSGIAAKVRLVQLVDLAEQSGMGISDPALSAAPPEMRLELKDLHDRLGKAGFISPGQRRLMQKLAKMFVALPAFASILIVFLATHGRANPGIYLFVVAFSAYFGLSAWLVFLRSRERDFEREVLFRLPLFLESLILVVESGMAVLPALESVISRRERVAAGDPVARIFNIAYRLASGGLPLEQALELVATHIRSRPLQHVLLHLDISANVGGELVPSLRSLSDHAHLEWKLAVEQRVRRLENLVVFPVFASVIGLIFLTAAVPLVPLLDLHNSLDTKHELKIRPLGEAQ